MQNLIQSDYQITKNDKKLFYIKYNQKASIHAFDIGCSLTKCFEYSRKSSACHPNIAC